MQMKLMKIVLKHTPVMCIIRQHYYAEQKVRPVLTYDPRSVYASVGHNHGLC